MKIRSAMLLLVGVVCALQGAPAAGADFVVNFTADRVLGAAPMYVSFTNNSTYPNDPNIEFLWDFGDGQFGVGRDANHLYMTAGVFTVSLAIHADGQVKTKTRESYITVLPMDSNFVGSPLTGEGPLRVDFENRTSTLGQLPTTFLWSFGDGTTSTEVHPSHTYTVPGTYDVSLQMWSDGKTATTTKPEYVRVVVVEPDFDAGPRAGAGPLTVYFSNKSETHNLPASYLWDFGDGASSAAKHPMHIYTEDGIYNVSLTVQTAKNEITVVREEYIFVGAQWVTFGGTRYLLSFMEDYAGFGTPTRSVIISSQDGASGHVSVPSLGYSTAFSVGPLGAQMISLPWQVRTAGSDLVQPLAVEVTAEGQVDVYGLSLGFRSAEGYAATPVEGWGTHYRVTAREAFTDSETDETHPSQLAVVAAYHGTTVAITPSVGTGQRVANTPFTVELSAGDVYQLQTDDPNEDLTGTVVTSSRPVGVFSGNRMAGVLAGEGDFLVEQMQPTEVWGTEFILSPLAGRSRGDVVRILANEAHTTIVSEGQGLAIWELHAGEMMEIHLDGIQRLTSDKPIFVQQFATGAYYEHPDADPEIMASYGDSFMMTVVPNDRFLNAYTLLTPVAFNLYYTFEGNVYQHYITIVALKEDVEAEAVIHNGVVVESAHFVPAGDDTHLIARYPVANGIHSVSSENPLGVYLYGYAFFDAYAFHGGYRMDDAELELDDQLVGALRRYFRFLDTNGDGRLSFEEYLSYTNAEDQFGLMDTNEDGFLTLDELLELSAGRVGTTNVVYVDFSQANVGSGTLESPFNSLNEAQIFVASGGTIRVIQGVSDETFTGAYGLQKPLRIESATKSGGKVGASL